MGTILTHMTTVLTHGVGTHMKTVLIHMRTVYGQYSHMETIPTGNTHT